MSKHSMSIAYAISKRNKAKKSSNEKLDPMHEPSAEMHPPQGAMNDDMAISHLAKGGMSHSSIAKSIMEKRMAHGGEVEADDEEMPMEMDSEEDDFLSDEDDMHGEMGSEHMPEDPEHEAESMPKSKGYLKKIFSSR